jgi:signal transduction histidine kinase
MGYAQRIEPIDSRLALLWYAALTIAGGFVLAAWGQAWLGTHLPGLPWGKAVVIRVAGSVVMAAGFCAVGLAEADAVSRKRALSWFIAAHGIVWLMLVVQIRGPLDSPLAVQASWALLAVTLGLLYVRAPSGVRAGDEPAARSRYEQQIRDVAAQEERNRLARDLHDAIKQQVFAVQTSAAAVEARFDADPSGARVALAQVRQSAREAMAEMEAMLDHLRVVPIENVGLVEAIRKQCDALAFRTGANVDVRVGTLPPAGSLESGAHQTIFRITQEALANVGRHARARQVWVSLEASNGRLVVRIEDAGAGIESGRTRSGMGIQNLRARAADLRGTLSLDPRAGGGTTVTLTVPYETLEVIAKRRRATRALAIIFGICAAIAFVRLLIQGFVFDNVLGVLFAVASVHNLIVYRRLREPRREVQ